MNDGESNKYGDFDPTTFSMEGDPREGDTPSDLSSEPVEVKPSDQEVEKCSEKIGRNEIQISPEEYAQALERVLTGPDRERLLDKTNKIIELLNKMDPDKKAKIIAVLKDTFSGIHKSSDNLQEAYETIEPFLDDILGELEAKK